MARIVIALGGNALGNNCQQQKELIEKSAKDIVALAKKGHEIILTHGNGPQVGMINLGMESFQMPFPECGAMSQGYIGYHLQQGIGNQLRLEKMNNQCVSVITQVVVDENDKGFKNPTKPIGSFYTKEQAIQLEKEKGFIFKEDAGRGYRRVVASPLPLEIIEQQMIEQLIENKNIVISVGGGGIPVIKKEGKLQGVAAVIDKDRSSSKLAQSLQADLLVILTAVDKVCLNYNQSNEIRLDKLNCTEAKTYISQEQFAKGSMLPKVEACIEFVEKTNRQAMITSLENLPNIFNEKIGTIIVI